MVHAKRMRMVPVAVCGGVIALTAAGIGAAGAQQRAPLDPPGNNGTVKIDKQPFDDHPNNEPHVGCVFEVDLYGYDVDQPTAHLTFEAHPPTTRDGDDQVLLKADVALDQDDRSGAGSEAGLDGHQAFDLSNALKSIEPHPKQGWHVKLTVNVPKSNGADVKHKVFWVSGCNGTPPPTTPPTSKPGEHGGGGGHHGGGGAVTPPPPAQPIEEPPPNTG